MASMLATDAAIKKINFGAETALKVSNKGLNDFMKIVKSLEESGLKKTERQISWYVIRYIRC